MYHLNLMFESGAPFTGSQLLETVRREEAPLFLSHAFITIGLLAAAFSCVSRKLSPLLLWFSLFSFLYGLHMWLEFDTTRLLIHSSVFLDRLHQGSSFLVPIPAFFYFEAAGFLSRYGRKIAWSLTVIYLCFFFGTLTYGRLPDIQLINSVIIIVSVAAANENEEEFGQERLQRTLREGSKLSAQEMADRIIHAVQQWSMSQEDDLTVLVCDYAAIASGAG